MGAAFLAATAGGLLALGFEKPKPAPAQPARGGREDLATVFDDVQARLERILNEPGASEEARARLKQDAADLFGLARLELRPPQRVVVSCASWLPLVETICAPAAAATGVRVRYPHEGGGLVGSPSALPRALAEVVRAAIERIPAAGEVAVRALVMGEVHVRDTGPVLSPQQAAALFSSARSEGGSPGRALAKAVVEAHGGAIHILSRPEQGTSIEVRLPRIPDIVSHKVY